MIKIDIDKAKSLIQEKRDVNLGQNFYDRLQVFNEDRFIRLNRAVFYMTTIELVDEDLDYDLDDKYYADEAVPLVEDFSMKSIDKYFSSLEKLAKLVGQGKRR